MTISVHLALSLAGGAEDKYPQADVYDSAGALVETVDLPHVADGLYVAVYEFVAAGSYSVLYTSYDDAGHTTPTAAIDPVSDSLGVLGAPGLLVINLPGGDTDKFPQSSVYDNAGALVTTEDLAHVADGLYAVAYDFPATGRYTVLYISYDDAPHTTPTVGEDYQVERVVIDAPGALDLGVRREVVIHKGESKSIVTPAATLNGVAIDLTGGVVHSTVRANVDDPLPSVLIDIDSSSEPAQFSIPDQTDEDNTGKVIVTFIPGDTSGLDVANLIWDVWVVLAGVQYTLVAPSAFKVRQPVTVL